MHFIKKFILTLIIFCGITYSQDTNIVKYFPLAIGNTWVYNVSVAYTFPLCYGTFYHRMNIDSARTFNGKTYYRINIIIKRIDGTGMCGYTFLSNGSYYRIDSVNGNVYKYALNSNCSSSPMEILLDSLKGTVGDTSKPCINGNFTKKLLLDTSEYQFLNFQAPSKKFQGGNFFEYGTFNRFAKNFGLVEYGEFGMSIHTESSLKGCVLNGTVYGDTNFYLVPLTPISNSVPETFALFQNYPNPFNPITQIKFSIPQSSYVDLVIINALGSEVESLFSKQLSTGIYQYDWDASAYPSGVYFYKLTAGDFTETKKMILLK